MPLGDPSLESEESFAVVPVHEHAESPLAEDRSGSVSDRAGRNLAVPPRAHRRDVAGRVAVTQETADTVGEAASHRSRNAGVGEMLVDEGVRLGALQVNGHRIGRRDEEPAERQRQHQFSHFIHLGFGPAAGSAGQTEKHKLPDSMS